MPELPEVENVIRTVQAACGTTITQCRLSRVAPLVHTTASAIRRATDNATITAITRRAKYIVIHCASDTRLLIHLGMSGQLRLCATREEVAKHTHCRLTLDNHTELRYVDPRRFGIISLAHTHLADHPYIAKLGPEYDDPTLTAQMYIERMRRHSKLNIKAALLHQGIVPGLGNIYACEALYLAQVDPRRLVNTLSDEELTRLYQAMRTTLDQGIVSGGTTLKDYVNGLGHRGEMQTLLQVYDREGKRTLDGRADVIKIVQNGRSTWFAPDVQR